MIKSRYTMLVFGCFLAASTLKASAFGCIGSQDLIGCDGYAYQQAEQYQRYQPYQQYQCQPYQQYQPYRLCQPYQQYYAYPQVPRFAPLPSGWWSRGPGGFMN
jgi:hypothetical protein